MCFLEHSKFALPAVICRYKDYMPGLINSFFTIYLCETDINRYLGKTKILFFLEHGSSFHPTEDKQCQKLWEKKE